MKKMTKIFAAFTAAAILILAACAPITGPASGKGIVNIDFGLASRTLLPSNLTFDSYDVTFTKDGQPAKELLNVTADSLSGIELDAGTYTLELKAYSGDPKVLAAEGSASVEVEADKTKTVTVSLTFKAASGGTGTLAVSVTNSSGLDLTKADLAWTPLSGGTAAGTQALSGLSGNKDLTAGYYIVTVILSNAERTAKRSDVAHIGAGQTTPLTWEFASAEFSTTVEDIWLLGVNNQWQDYSGANKLTQAADGTFGWKGDMSHSYFRFSLEDTSGWTDDKDKPKRFQPEADGTTITLGTSASMNYVANNDGTPTAWDLGGPGYYQFVVDPYGKTVTVTKPVEVTGVIIKKEGGETVTAISLAQGTTNYQFIAGVEGHNAASTGVTWGISSGTAAGTGIAADGKLTIAEAEIVGTDRFTITATSSLDTTKKASVTITVTSKGAAALPTPQNVTLSDQGVAAWSAPSVETNVVKYSVQLYKGSDPVAGQAREVSKGSTYSEDFISAMRGAGAGSYTVKVKAVGDGTNYSESPEAVSTAQTVSLKTEVVNVWWFETTKARWVNVDGDSNYAVQLYKGDAPVGALVSANRSSDVNPGNTAETVTTYDFTSDINGSGPGSYTFGVVTKGDAYLGLDAAEKKLTAPYYYDVQLAAPTNLIWSGDTAQWDAVTGAAGYSVQLYKDNTASGSPVTVSSTSYAGFDVSAGGVYTFKVKALGTGTAGTGVYLDSSEATSVQLTVGVTGASITLSASDQWTGTLTTNGGGSPSIARSDGSLTITITGSSFATFVWIVDGDVVTGQVSSSITLNGGSYRLGGHSVTVYAVDTNNIPWSPESPIVFTVTAQ
jgi:hypothetical protein